MAVTMIPVAAGHEAADGSVSCQESLLLKQEKRLLAANAMLPPAHTHLAPNVPSGECIGRCTLSDVVADITKVKGEKEQVGEHPPAASLVGLIQTGSFV